MRGSVFTLVPCVCSSSHRCACVFDLCLLFTCQWPGRDDAEVLVNKELVTVQTETFGPCRVTMIKNVAHTGVLGIPGQFQHKLSSIEPTSMMLLHN